MVTARRSPELEALAEAARQAYRRRDNEWLQHRLAEGDVVSYGTAPGEEWLGRDSVLQLTFEQVEAMNRDAGIEPPDESPPQQRDAWEAGDTGWVVTHDEFVFADGSRVPVRTDHDSRPRGR